MKINLDTAAPTPADDAAAEKFDRALENSESDQDQLSQIASSAVVSVMGNIMMRVAGDVLSDGMSDD